MHGLGDEGDEVNEMNKAPELAVNELRSCGRSLRVEEGTGAGEGTGGASNEPILEEVHRLEQAGLARARGLQGQLVAEYRHLKTKLMAGSESNNHTRPASGRPSKSPPRH